MTGSEAQVAPAAAGRTWKGVRFARAERFRAPVPVPFDPAAPAHQDEVAPWQDPPGYVDLGAPVAEDCLTLSVWAPPASQALRPVVVQLYGGGFEHGANTTWVSDGSRLSAEADVVVVAPNYRVGAFGFLSLSHLGGPFAAATNLGLQDVVAALEFVLENAAHFGGDPDDVTVLGESAGGFLAAALAAVPRVRDRLRRVAVFSAGASRLVPQETAEAMADRFLDHLGLRDRPEELLDLPPEQLLAAQRAVVGTDIGRRNGPAPEALGVVLDAGLPQGVLERHPADAVADGALAGTDLLVSALVDEIGSFRAADPDAFAPPSVEALVAEVEAFGLSRDRAGALVASYGGGPDGAADDDLGGVRERLLTDYVYRLPVARLATAQREAGGRAHLLLIGGVDGRPATHGSDVPALVGRSFPGATGAARERDAAVTAVVTSFVRGDALPWGPVGERPVAQGLGEVPGDPTSTYETVLERWAGSPRP